MEYKGEEFFKPGQIFPGVSGWEEHAGVLVPILTSLPEREPYEDVVHRLGWSLDKDEEIEATKTALSKAKKRKGINEASEKKRLDNISRLESDLKALIKKRKSLTEWEDKEIRRCYNGWGPLTGAHYMHWRFGKIEQNVVRQGKSATRAFAPPSYRLLDQIFFRSILEGETSRTGLCLIKRRQIGASWNAVADICHEVITKNGSCFYTSDSERKVLDFLVRVKNYMSQLPPFLRPEVVKDATRGKIFAPVKRVSLALGRDPAVTPNSEVVTGLPSNPDSFEGQNVSKFYVDEAGLIQNLNEILPKGLPMITAPNGVDRGGALIMFGTVGEMNAAGRTFKKIFENPVANEVQSIFLPAYYGYANDELGNPSIEAFMLKWEKTIAAYERAGNFRELVIYKQKYPMSLKDAFLIDSSQYVWPINHIEMAEENYPEYSKKFKFGLFIRDAAGKPKFVRQPINHGGMAKIVGYNQVIMLEEYIPSKWMHPYVGGCDPVPHKQRGDDLRNSRYKPSDISFVIYKRHEEIGGMSDFPVCAYIGLPQDHNEWYEQVLLACEYYGDCLINVENDHGGTLISYFESNRKQHLLARGAGVAIGIDKRQHTYGFKSSGRWWDQMIDMGRKWWMKNADKPMPLQLIEESKVVAKENTDMVAAFLAALQLSIEIDLRESKGMKRMRADEEAPELAMLKASRKAIGRSIEPTGMASEWNNQVRKLRGQR